MVSIQSSILVLNALVFGSIFFVWVVRYQNIIEEFRLYKLPDWLRDLVGILKLSFALMLHSTNLHVNLVGSSGLVILMASALITHWRVSNPFKKMIPAICLLTISSFIFYYHFLKI
ncbi:MAG: hypothetical protein G3M70_11275 [Candidatus Nitronauta litoralis]|uniref:DoxX family protein n=1 Tax=Candidatus Nitronauta litoralis TaxID=2705533 RepID=A0A7T0G0I2_9BACT|nr:MAG: hypothetical protein G3M70_11275 [Candidatus Nitronauta litoralis]